MALPFVSCVSNCYYAPMICIIACGSEKVKYIGAALGDFGEDYRIVPLDEVHSTNFNEYSGIIISGSPILLIEDEDNYYVNTFTFLKTYERPVLGICFGHQVLGLVHGAMISIGESIKGMEEIQAVHESPLFVGIASPAAFDQNHREHITVPPRFKLLATSASCENEAMEHENRCLYGVQFHPETSGDVGKKLLQNFIQLCE